MLCSNKQECWYLARLNRLIRKVFKWTNTLAYLSVTLVKKKDDVPYDYDRVFVPG